MNYYDFPVTLNATAFGVILRKWLRGIEADRIKGGKANNL
jgi:hypothetical protein